MARQSAAGRCKKLAGIGFLSVTFVARNRQAQAEGIDEVVQIKCAVAVDAADRCAMGANLSCLILNKRVNCINQRSYAFGSLPGSCQFWRISTETN